jgi:HD-GYP domain-containing protein (c-di-GMP phosphodiesterase class II)
MEHTNLELLAAYEATIEGWARALELRDKETLGHSERVIDLTLRLASVIGIPREQFAQLRRGVLLHDIGKMGVPDNILLKPGPLSQDEWVIMKQHPTFAYEMLSGIPYLREALDVPYSHHERWDGTGYPQGLSGENIPLSARIFSIVDVWDALTSKRPYRPAWREQDTKSYIRDQAGKQFDPQIVEAFLRMLD